MKFVKSAVLCLKVFVEAFVSAWAGGTVLWYAFRFADNYCHFGPPSPLSWHSAANDMLPVAFVGAFFDLFRRYYIARLELERQEKAAQEPQKAEE